MMDVVVLLRWLHVIGAAVLFGTGAGIAFFMLMAHRTREPRIIAHTAQVVVIADTIFTASAVVLQPVTGYALASQLGWTLRDGWLTVSIALYLLTGLCWLPVVWVQLQLRDLAKEAALKGRSLPAAYNRLFRIWMACGIPAFAAVLAIFWLMLARPHFRLW